jgi:hypothetical protein
MNRIVTQGPNKTAVLPLRKYRVTKTVKLRVDVLASNVSEARRMTEVMHDSRYDRRGVRFLAERVLKTSEGDHVLPGPAMS